MEDFNLTPQQLSNIINNNEHVSHGCYGLVVKLNNDTLLKFKYKEFIDCFNLKDNTYQLNQLNDISKKVLSHKKINKIVYGGIDTLETQYVKSLISMQPQIKRSSLTKAIVRVNGYCVGYLLKYHKNMVELYDYIKNNNISNNEQNIILGKIKDAMQELVNNNIYLRDFTTRNILYCPKTHQIQIIDFEDSLICYGLKDDKYCREMQKQFNEIVKFISKDKAELSL